MRLIIIIAIFSGSIARCFSQDSAWYKLSVEEYNMFKNLQLSEVTSQRPWWNDSIIVHAPSPNYNNNSEYSDRFSISDDQNAPNYMLPQIFDLIKLGLGFAGNVTQEKSYTPREAVKAAIDKMKSLEKYYKKFQKGKIPEAMYEFHLRELKSIKLTVE